MGILPDSLHLFGRLDTVLDGTQSAKIIGLFLCHFQFQCRHFFVFSPGHLFGRIFQSFARNL